MYKHKKAYCLMKFLCSTCNHLEEIWNSRDGVIPNMISCSKCKGNMIHLPKAVDVCRPEYLPKKGERVIVDMTPEIAEIYNKMLVGMCWDRGAIPMSSLYKTKQEALEALSGNFEQGEPHILIL